MNRSVVTSVGDSTHSVFDFGNSERSLMIFNSAGSDERLRIAQFPGNIETVISQSINTWYHMAFTFDGNTSVKAFEDGTQISSATHSVNTGDGDLFIGSISNVRGFFPGKMSDFRIYDYALSSSEILSLFMNGPNFIIPDPLVISPRVSNLLTTITPVAGAIGYRLTSQPSGSPTESIINDGFTDIEQRISRLRPSTEYTIRLYSTTDGSVYTLVQTSVVNTLANLGSNYDKNDYLSNGRFDLSTLDDETDELLSEVIDDVFTTGDPMTINVSGRNQRSTFVNRGSTVSVADTDAIIAPFSTDGGSGQGVFLTLSDASTVSVAFDETTEEVTVDGTSYDAGDSLILDGKKATIVDI